MTPFVTIAVPLYRSRRFLDVVLENLDALDCPDAEILISDRHGDDDALSIVRERYSSDPRFRFLEGRERMDWVAHFNLLLARGRGKYFLWMAHDDSYPSSYVPALTQRLEKEPEAALAFGRVEQVSLDGFLPTFPFRPPPVTPDAPWSLDDALRCLTLWQLWIAFRGVFRRDIVVEHGLYIRPTHGNVRADIYWLFALSLRGALRYVPETHCTKRFHRDSGGASWSFGPRQSLDAWHVLRSYLSDSGPATVVPAKARALVCAWCMVQGVLPAAVARVLGIAVRRASLGATQPTGEIA